MSKGPIEREITESMLDDAYDAWSNDINDKYQILKREGHKPSLDHLIREFIEERGIKELRKSVAEYKRERERRRGRRA